MVNRVSAQTKFEIVARETRVSDNPQSGEPIDMSLPHDVQVSSIGLILPETLNEEQWKAVGLKLVTMETSLQWAIGDWWAYGRHTYGKRASLAAAKTLPYSFESLMNLGSVARKVPTSLRNEVLSWSHHAALAHLARDEQARWIRKSVRNSWSVKKLRQQLQRRDQPEETEQEWAASWGRHFIERAQRAGSWSHWDDPLLDRMTEGAIAELVENAKVAADQWKKMAVGLRKYQQKRNEEGDNFKPRPLPTKTNVPVLEAAE